MNETIQFHLLRMIDSSVRVLTEKKLNSPIVIFVDYKAIVSFKVHIEILFEVPEQQVASVPRTSCSRNYRFSIIKGNAIVVGKHIQC